MPDGKIQCGGQNVTVGLLVFGEFSTVVVKASEATARYIDGIAITFSALSRDVTYLKMKVRERERWAACLVCSGGFQLLKYSTDSGRPSF